MSGQLLVQLIEDMALEMMPRNVERNKGSGLCGLFHDFLASRLVGKLSPIFGECRCAS